MRTNNQILAVTLGVVLFVLGGCGAERGVESNIDVPRGDSGSILSFWR